MKPFAPKSSLLLVAALAAALVSPGTTAAEDTKDCEKELQVCWGINSCKGTGDCGAEGCRHSGCHGSNACKGQGFVRVPKDACLRIEGGRLTRAPEAKGGKS